MSDLQKKNIKFISDAEAIEDAFGVHTQTARALSEIITSNIQNAIRTIGLLGDWGSGKSTVVKYTHDILEKNQPGKYFFFTFDAWLHQGDAPRRSFLESLIDCGCKNNLLQEEKYAALKGKIQGRHENHEIKTTPIFTIWGVLIAFSILFIPLAARMYVNTASILSLENLPALTLTALPLLIAICNYTFWRDIALFSGITPKIICLICGVIFFGCLWFFNEDITQATGGNALSQALKLSVPGFLIFLIWAIFEFIKYNIKFFSTHREEYKDRSIAELFINKSTSRVTNRIVKTPDPTSIEFAALFHKIISEFCVKNKIVVIIFDNLDRVEKNIALNMWAMIRSLLTNKTGTNCSSGYVEPFVIIPLDKTSIDLLYDTKSNTDAERSNSFADKTFDVVLKLSPPIFSDWEEYLGKQIQYSFGAIVSTQEHAVINKFFRFANEQKDHYLSKITPRKLNSILNKSAAKCLLWDNSIPVCTVFYYTLFEEMLGEKLEGIKNAPLQQVLLNNDPVWLESLASLHYGVDKTKAMQIHIEPKIIEAIQSGDIDNFVENSKIPGFTTVLERVIEKNETTKVDIRFILNLTAFMERLSLNGLETFRVKGMIPNLYTLFNNAEKWSYDKASLQGLRVFLDAGIGTIDQILERMALSLNENAKNWASNFSSFIGLLTEEEIELVNKHLYVPGDSGQFIEILYELMDNKALASRNNLMKNFTPQADGEAVAQSFLVFSEEQDNYNGDSNLLLQRLRDIEPQIPLTGVFERIRNILNQSHSGNKHVGWALTALLNIGFTDVKKSKEILNDGYIFDLYYTLSNSNTNKETELKNIIILLSILFCPSLTANAVLNSQSGINLIMQHRDDDSFANSFSVDADAAMSKSHHLKIFNLLINQASGITEWDKIITALVSYKLNKNSNLGHIYTSLLTDNLHKIFSYIKDEATMRLLGAYIGSQSWFFERILEINGDETAFKAFKLFDGTEHAQKSDHAFFDYISGKDSKWWEEAFNHVLEAYFPINKLAAARPNLHDKELGDNFLQAYEKHLDLFNGDELIKLPNAAHNWANLLLYLDSDKKTVFLNNAYDIINETIEINANSLLILYVNLICELPVVKRDYDKLARRLLGIIKFDQISDDELCLIHDPKAYKELINNAQEATRNEIRKALSRRYTDSTDENEKEKLANALQILGFNIPSKKRGKAEKLSEEVISPKMP